MGRAVYHVPMPLLPATVNDALRTARQHVHAAFAGTHDADAALQAACAVLDDALGVHADDTRLLTALGTVYCDRGQYAQASALLRRALAMGSDDRHAAFNLGVALLNLGRSSQARTAFNTAATMTASAHTWEAWFYPQAH